MLPRVEYADRAMAAARRYLSVPEETRWICSCESRDVRPELRRLMTEVAARHNFELLWHDGEPHIANHLNWIAENVLGDEPYFCIQEDIELTDTIDIRKGLAKLDPDTLPYIRYYIIPFKEKEIMSYGVEDGFAVYPEHNFRKFSHACYLATPDLIRDKWIGPVPVTDDQEAQLTLRLHHKGCKVLALRGRFMQHLGHHSVMCHHGLPASDPVDEHFELVPVVDDFSEKARIYMCSILRYYQPASIASIGVGDSSDLFQCYADAHPLTTYVNDPPDDRYIFDMLVVGPRDVVSELISRTQQHSGPETLLAVHSDLLQDPRFTVEVLNPLYRGRNIRGHGSAGWTYFVSPEYRELLRECQNPYVPRLIR